ncbi:TPR REGION domain-containing protein [Abeliophyllum distichum]|uniref:TPR REGION domain-containing protein n=1 Tax=Abeliophyllum distichum TaxID=126358 RepID=A0ABD1V7T5_9LAMI
MGDLSVEVIEENRNASQQAKIQAMEAIFEDKLEEAIKYLTMVILLNPKSANMYSTKDYAASKLDYDEEISVALKKRSSSSGSQGGMPGGLLGGMPRGFPGWTPGGYPGSMPGFFPGSMPGGMHGNIDYNKILKILNNPELMVAFKDPEVMAALQDCT